MNIGTACCRRPDCADRECEGRPTTDLLAQCATSGQMSAAQMVAHARAGEFAIAADPIGIECALPIQYVGPEPKEPWWRLPAVGARKPLPPTDWSAVTRWGAAVAVCLLWTAVVIWR